MKKNQKITKGMPSAVLLSILIHAALFLLAGLLVVFTVVKKEEKQFAPPKAVERPKMKLRKPKVKVKKTSKPKPTTRIVTKVQKANMPDIQLPEMSGMGEGLSGGVGGFEMMPDLSEITLFGQEFSIGNDFEGSFYDFKRDRKGRNIPYSIEGYYSALKKFLDSGWKPSAFARYWRLPKKLHATTIMIPPIPSALVPELFGEPETTIPSLWAVHYKGKLVHKDGITFRFWGTGDDVLVVAVDGKTVLNACWPAEGWGTDWSAFLTPYWESDSADSCKYLYNYLPVRVGDWITLEPGVPLDMEVLIGERVGAFFSAVLAVEVKGVEYERGPKGNPILPIFKTAKPSLDQIETIHEYLFPGEVCVTNGPVFCDYDTSSVASGNPEPETLEPPVFAESVEKEMRTWGDKKTLEAEFVTVFGDKAVLTDSRGRLRKIPLAQLSDEDRMYVELARPPKFNIDLSKKTNKRIFPANLLYPSPIWVPTQFNYVFSTRLKQISAGEYNHELKVEFFAIGEEVEADNYILLDRQESRFTPTRENGRSHEFSGITVPLRIYGGFTIGAGGPLSTHDIERRGQKYGGYLVVVTDERGMIVDYGASHKWLLGILNNLRRLPPGKHFDKTGIRVEPPRPTRVGW